MFNIKFLGGRNIGNNILQFNTEDENWDRIENWQTNTIIMLFPW